MCVCFRAHVCVRACMNLVCGVSARAYVCANVCSGVCRVFVSTIFTPPLLFLSEIRFFCQHARVGHDTDAKPPAAHWSKIQYKLRGGGPF